MQLDVEVSPPAKPHTLPQNFAVANLDELSTQLFPLLKLPAGLQVWLEDLYIAHSGP